MPENIHALAPESLAEWDADAVTWSDSWSLPFSLAGIRIRTLIRALRDAVSRVGELEAERAALIARMDEWGAWPLAEEGETRGNAILRDLRALIEKDPTVADEYPAGHGWTPHTGPFSDGSACHVMLSRYPCNYSRAEHDPSLPPVEVDVFGYRASRRDEAALSPTDPTKEAVNQRCGANGGHGAPYSHRCTCNHRPHPDAKHGCHCGAIWTCADCPDADPTEGCAACGAVPPALTEKGAGCG